MKEIKQLIKQLDTETAWLLAIDGNCGAGKTTLANELSEYFKIPVIHLDDYYLPFAQRTKEQITIGLPNVDHNRFLTEVLFPYQQHSTITYRRYDCHQDYFYAPVSIPFHKRMIIEGSYAMHPLFQSYYTHSLFVCCDKESQQQRLQLRNAKTFPMFVSTWIPMEQAYFDQFHVQQSCTWCMDTSEHKEKKPVSWLL